MEPAALIQRAAALISEGDEVNHRLAAHSAYYSCYHACTALADALCLPLPLPNEDQSEGKHAKLYRRLADANPTPPGLRRYELPQLADLLRKLRRIRVEADYKLEEKFTDSRAAFAVALGERIHKDAQRLLDNAAAARDNTSQQ